MESHEAVDYYATKGSNINIVVHKKSQMCDLPAMSKSQTNSSSMIQFQLSLLGLAASLVIFLLSNVFEILPFLALLVHIAWSTDSHYLIAFNWIVKPGRRSLTASIISALEFIFVLIRRNKPKVTRVVAQGRPLKRKFSVIFVTAFLFTLVTTKTDFFQVAI